MSESNQTPPSRPELEQAGATDESIQQVHSVMMRERPEPREGDNPVPLVLNILFAGLVFWGGVYLERYSGGFSPTATSHLVKVQRDGVAAPEAPPDPMVLGRRVFTQQCATCHQATGIGVAGVFPTLVDSEWVVGPGSERVLKKLVLHGMSGPITVKGASYNGAMPAFGATLRDNQIAAVLTYIRNEWGNQAPPITPEEVAGVRAEIGTRPPWPGPELQALLGPK